MMKIMVVGLGSMGRRRIRLLQAYDSLTQIVGVDIRKARREQAENELHIETEESIETAYEKMKPEMAFISTSPLSHASIMTKCLNMGMHIFTELNLTDEGYDENMKLAKDKGLVIFLSSTFLYRKEIQYIKREVKNCKCKLSYMYHAGQYLPDWHPWENYKSFFVGNKRTNGCREFMAIEFPWIFDVFGRVEKMYSVSLHNSTLDIDFPDTYQLALEHKKGHRGLITFDIVSRKAVRNLEISGENLYITWNGTPDGLMNYDFMNKEENRIFLYDKVDKRLDYNASIIENAYLNEIENFIDVVNGNDMPAYSFEKDRYVLAKIDEVEGINR